MSSSSPSVASSRNQVRTLARSAWLVFALIAPVYLLSIFQRVAPSILAPDLAISLGVPISDLALMSGGMFIAYGLMQLPSGLLTDAVGGRRTLALLTLMAGGGTVLFALSPSLSTATGARILTGFGCAACVPCLGILARTFPAHLYARVSGMFMACGIAGTVLAGTPLAWATGLLGWRLVMLMVGAITVLLALLVWLLIPEQREMTSVSEEKSGLSDLGRGLRHVLATPSFWPLCLWFACQAGLFFAFGGLWWGPYLMEGCGLSQAQAGSIVSLAYLFTIPGQPLMAALSDKLRSRKKIFQLCSAVALGCMLIYFFFGPRMSYAMLVFHAILFGLSGSTFGSVAFASTREMFSLSQVGTATGWLQTLPYLLMVPLIQKLFGVVLEWRLQTNGGESMVAYTDAILVNIVFLALAFIIALLIKETYPQ